jgi:putative ABC transport system permease protein
VSASQHKQVLRMSKVSPSFFATYGMTILAGQPIVGSGDTTVVVDAKAARALGFATPQQAIGQMVRGGGAFLQEGKDERRIVAVVKDVKLESARNPALPQGFILTDKPQWDISIYGRDLESLRQTVAELWKAHGPASRYELQSADDQRAAIYSQEQRLTTMLTAVALLSVGVAMLGAYTLVADALRRRRTELVLRRLHGAGHAAIVRELANEFTPPFIVAIVLGLPLALWLGERYLGGFVDRVATGIGVVAPMIIAVVATLLVAALATLQHVRRALRLQPIEAMR